MSTGTIVRQSVHSGFFFMLTNASRLLLVIALGKSLSVQEYGIFSLVTAIVLSAATFFPLGVTQYYVREIPGVSKPRAVEIFKSVVGVQMIILAGILSLTLTIPPLRSFASEKLGLGTNSSLLFLVAALLIGEALVTDFGRFLYFRKQIQQGNWVSFLQAGLWGYFAFLVFFLKPGFLTIHFVLLIWIGALLAAMLYGGCQIGIGALVRTPARLDLYWKALQFGFPTLACQSFLLANLSSRFLVAQQYSTQAVGLYTYPLNIILMIGALSAPLVGNPIEPYALEAYNQGDVNRSGKLLSVSARYRLVLVIPLLIIAAVWSQPLIQLLAKKEFAVSNGLMLLLTPIPLFMILANVFDRLLFLKRKTHTIAWCYLTAGFIQIILYRLLTPLHPIYGVAAAAVCGAGVLTFILWCGSRPATVPITIPLTQIGLAAVPVAILAWLCSKYLTGPNHFLVLAGGTTVVGGSYLAMVLLLRIIPLEEIRRIRKGGG